MYICICVVMMYACITRKRGFDVLVLVLVYDMICNDVVVVCFSKIS